jgi:O-antigen/teichoic acid export membrane protein
MIEGTSTFRKNIILVFLGNSLLNFFNLLYQLFIAHRLNPVDFAAFNSLLTLFILIANPLNTLQFATAKYTAEFNAQNQEQKIRVLLSAILKLSILLAVLLFFGFYLSSFYLMEKLKIYSFSSGFIVALLISLFCILPVFLGGLQGLELFKWFVPVTVISGALKLIFAIVLIGLGFNIAGAFAAFLFATLIAIFIAYIPLNNFFTLQKTNEKIDLREIFLYFFPITMSTFCFTALVSFDMVLVKYFFTPKDAGLYSLAQMLGKIFLFLPAAISIVMFPHTSGLKAKNLDTTYILKKSLFYAAILCSITTLGYNLFPSLVFRILTGKVFLQTVMLGRLFSISMSFYALLSILILYFLSINDLRFIKYLIFFTLVQLLAINIFHKDLMQVQLILCINSILLFLIHLAFINKKKCFGI